LPGRLGSEIKTTKLRTKLFRSMNIRKLYHFICTYSTSTKKRKFASFDMIDADEKPVYFFVERKFLSQRNCFKLGESNKCFLASSVERNNVRFKKYERSVERRPVIWSRWGYPVSARGRLMRDFSGVLSRPPLLAYATWRSFSDLARPMQCKESVVSRGVIKCCGREQKRTRAGMQFTCAFQPLRYLSQKHFAGVFHRKDE
jgi:hypothetical protein